MGIRAGCMKKEGKAKSSWVWFLLGVVASLIVGWVAFPALIHSRQTQPVNFSHLKHQEGAGLQCVECHYFQG